VNKRSTKRRYNKEVGSTPALRNNKDSKGEKENGDKKKKKKMTVTAKVRKTKPVEK